MHIRAPQSGRGRSEAPVYWTGTTRGWPFAPTYTTKALPSVTAKSVLRSTVRLTGSTYSLAAFTANHPTAIPTAKVMLRSSAGRFMISSSEVPTRAS